MIVLLLAGLLSGEDDLSAPPPSQEQVEAVLRQHGVDPSRFRPSGSTRQGIFSMPTEDPRVFDLAQQVARQCAAQQAEMAALEREGTEPSEEWAALRRRHLAAWAPLLDLARDLHPRLARIATESEVRFVGMMSLYAQTRVAAENLDEIALAQDFLLGLAGVRIHPGKVPPDLNGISRGRFKDWGSLLANHPTLLADPGPDGQRARRLLDDLVTICEGTEVVAWTSVDEDLRDFMGSFRWAVTGLVTTEVGRQAAERIARAIAKALPPRVPDGALALHHADFAWYGPNYPWCVAMAELGQGQVAAYDRLCATFEDPLRGPASYRVSRRMPPGEPGLPAEADPLADDVMTWRWVQAVGSLSLADLPLRDGAQAIGRSVHAGRLVALRAADDLIAGRAPAFDPQGARAFALDSLLLPIDDRRALNQIGRARARFQRPVPPDALVGPDDPELLVRLTGSGSDGRPLPSQPGPPTANPQGAR